MKKIVLATKNPGKVAELQAVLDGVELLSMRDLVPPSFEVAETGSTFAENAWLKASALCSATGMPALADDSGLEVDALDGRPGVYSARYAGPGASDAENNGLLLQELMSRPRAERRGRFRCVLVLASPGASGIVRVAEVSGVMEGHIVDLPRGDGGFGYDPLFEPLEFPGQTNGELSPAQKNSISHRGKAARQLAEAMRSWLALGD